MVGGKYFETFEVNLAVSVLNFFLLRRTLVICILYVAVFTALPLVPPWLFEAKVVIKDFGGQFWPNFVTKNVQTENIC